HSAPRTCSLFPYTTLFRSDKELLLILDNCEHLLDTCSVVVGAILRGTPGIRVLATSRQPLNRDGEFVYPVPPLAVERLTAGGQKDRKSTRLNSSHVAISYA